MFEELAKVSVLLMEHSGCQSRIMKADRLVGDQVFRLPPGKVIPTIPIHCLPGCPESWVRGPGTYIVPAEVNVGLWFDWTMNQPNFAIIPSVKGMNPINGKKLDALKLEQYRDKCPDHDIALAHNRHCEKCGYDLPPQNYVSYPNKLWWDGFRQPDGTVRQFFFTEDDARDIASAVIGKENTVPAFGFAFFKTKKERFIEREITRGFNFNEPVCSEFSESAIDHSDFGTLVLYSASISEDNTKGFISTSNSNDNILFKKSSSKMSAKRSGAGGTSIKLCSASRSMSHPEISPYEIDHSIAEEPRDISPQQIKDVSVGAGARINQMLEVDTLALDEYKEDPYALIRLYFVFQSQLKQILDLGGINPLENKPEGYMENLKVG